MNMAENSLKRPKILIVDDDEQIRDLLRELLCEAHECVVAGSADEALSILQAARFDLVLSDINLGAGSGLDLVPRIIKQAAETVVIMISGQQSIDFAIGALRVGAFDYIMKPFDVRHVEAAVRRALAQHRLLKEKQQYEDNLEELVRQRTAEIEHLAYHDRLTDLPNRILFADRCAQAIAIAQRNKHGVAVLLVSLDRLNRVTEIFGHAAGDTVLTEAAVRLRNCIGNGDTVGRFDGDEFAVLLTRLNQAGDATEAAIAIGQALKPPFRLSEQDVYVTASIGIGIFPNNGENSTTLLRNTEAALYRAKRSGGNNYQFYAAEMNDLAIKRLALETSLRRAVENNEFIVYYQPVLSMSSGQVVGVEALVRWRHPEFGILPPAKFIGLAEETGLILEIGQMVLRTACAQARIWEGYGYGSLRMAVNISARHFQQKNFLEEVVDILDETKLDPRRLELELTESSMIENAESAANLLRQLRTLGVRAAIDDFGTGYSSLSYLKRLPIGTVKLDRSFVNGATTDPNDAALVMAIITLAHNLELKVIAEGVETYEQRNFLRLLRCDEGQGYLFGKPMPAGIFASSLSANPTRKQNCLVKNIKPDPNALSSRSAL
jgi:diguanylate cyclase (GGDEF)-like protein